MSLGSASTSSSLSTRLGTVDNVLNFAGFLCFGQVAGLEALNAEIDRTRIVEEGKLIRQPTTGILQVNHPGWFRFKAAYAVFFVTHIFDLWEPNDLVAYCHEALIDEVYA